MDCDLDGVRKNIRYDTVLWLQNGIFFKKREENILNLGNLYWSVLREIMISANYFEMVLQIEDRCK